MIANTAIRNNLRKGQTYMLPNIMEVSQSERMCTLNQSLANLVHRGIITEKEAMAKSPNPEILASKLQTAFESDLKNKQIQMTEQELNTKKKPVPDAVKAEHAAHI
jgi:Tfp pilus assembly ATPase PilU